jgi:catechol-2,3-dioxygenase
MIFINSPRVDWWLRISRIRESVVNQVRRRRDRALTGRKRRYLLRRLMNIQNAALGHIVLNVADLRKSERFYRSILGLKVSARNLDTKMTFMSYGKEHHDVALQALPKGVKHVSGKGAPKLHHFCVYVDSNDIIEKIYPLLKRRKIPIVSGPETLVVAGNRSISFLDPDGNRVEIACNANKFKFDNRKRRRS